MQTKSIFVRWVVALLVILMAAFTNMPQVAATSTDHTVTAVEAPPNLDIPTLLKNAGLDPAVVMPASAEADSDYAWHTFYGSDSHDYARGIALDSSGNLYIVGQAIRSWNGPAGQAPLHPLVTEYEYDIFILKLSSSGDYLWHTFHGGSSSETVLAMSLDENGGSIYITGWSEGPWTGPSGQGPLNPYNDDFDVFVFKLSMNGDYQWHTFYGGTLEESGRGIVADGSGVYIGGRSEGTWNGPIGQAPLHAHNSDMDAFVLKLAPDGAYQWHTFYGSSAYDSGSNITVDGSGSGNVYLIGSSESPWNGPTGQTPLQDHNGTYAMYVLKLSSSGTYQWHTFYSDTTIPYGYGLASDSNNYLYISGFTRATWNGPIGQSPLHAFSGLDDVFVLKLSSSGAYQWHTFMGGSGYDAAHDISIGGSSDEYVYVLGSSSSYWTGPSGQAPLNSHGGGWQDILLLKLTSSGAYEWHTYYGGSDSDNGYAIANDDNGNIYAASDSYTTWDGPAGQAPLNTYSNNSDTVFIKHGEGATPVTSKAPDEPLWQDFHGGTDEDVGEGIIAASDGGWYIVGTSKAAWDGPQGQAPLHAWSGSDDAFILKLSATGAYEWHTFYGCATDDTGVGLTLDNNGDLYITGSSNSTWNGPSGDAPMNAYVAGSDLYVLKLSAAGAYQWHTFYGGTGDDQGSALTFSGSDKIHITGSSSDSWNGPAGDAPLDAHAGMEDALVLTLSTSGVYAWHLFAGGSSIDYGGAIVYDANDNGSLIISGGSMDTWNGPSAAAPVNTHSGNFDALYVKVDMDGAYQWHTFHGCADNDFGNDLVVDSSGSLFTTGNSGNAWDGPEAQIPKHAHSGQAELFVMKLNTHGVFIWHTFFGSSSTDTGRALVQNPADGSLYIAGMSDASWDGPAGELPENAHGGDADVMVLKLTSTGVYEWHAFYGGADPDEAFGIGIDANGSVAITGSSDGAWTGSSSMLPMAVDSVNSDVFILKMGEIHEMFLPLIRRF